MINALERFGNMAEEEILEDGVLQFLQKHKIGMQIISKCEARLLNLLLETVAAIRTLSS